MAPLEELGRCPAWKLIQCRRGLVAYFGRTIPSGVRTDVLRWYGRTFSGGTDGRSQVEASRELAVAKD